MDKINLSNFLFSFKTIKKSALNLSYIALLTCSAQASNNLNDLADRAEGFVNQRIIQPSTDFFQDATRYVERRNRPEPTNYLDLVSQEISDLYEDIKTRTERKLVRPVRNWVENLL